MQRTSIELLAIYLLNDNKGVNQLAWDHLYPILVENQCNDILTKVKATEGRYYLTEEDTNSLIQEVN